MNILRLALPVPLRKIFDYLPLNNTDIAALVPGMRMRVPFQRRSLIGIYLNTATHTEVDPKKLKTIEEVLDSFSLLPPETIKLCLWAAEYYHYPLGEVLHAAFPALLRKGKPLPKEGKKVIPPEAALDPALPLNQKQQAIVQAVCASLGTFSVLTVDGVTGSGKTEVYLHAIEQVLAQHKQALVLIPEINLTPQTIEHFRHRFAVPIVALHSGLTEKAKLLAWLAASRGEARIVIGTRSAIFTPLAALGLIVVDEEHDSSFKQQDGFRYHARDVAIWRARDACVPIMLGSATLSLETIRSAREGRYRYFDLPERAGGASLPHFHILDVRRQHMEEGVSAALLQQMTKHLQAGNQVLLFLNRRGYSPVLICHICGWMAVCKHCDARMTYHLRPLRLHCHHCEAQVPVPKLCGHCGEKELNTLGMGTERLELALQKYFPDVSIVRIDRDTMRHKGKMEQALSDIHSAKHKILIGTQMIAKGHHFPDVTLVGIIDSDYGLFSSDFRASERLGQLILQVAGRAGRAAKVGEVCIQTHHPEHPLILLLKQGDYQQFALSLLAEREQAAMPPFSALALFHAEAHKPIEVENFLNEVKKIALALNTSVCIRGPVTALMARRAGRHRMQLLLQADQKKILQSFLRQLLKKVDTFSSKLRISWAVDIDPIEMM